MEFKPWYYLQESVELEVLLTESFKEKKLQFLKQGATREEIDEYFPIFQRIQKTNYKKVADVIPGLTVAAPNRKNIDMYPNFQQLKIFVDYMRSREDLEERASTDIQTTGRPIVDNNILEISYADNPQACITYKGDIPYSWCVARKSENYYYNYRLQGNEPSFYFVKNKIRTEKELSSWKPEDIKEGITWKDPWHFFVIQVLLGADLDDQDRKQYVVTSAQNDSDQPMSWSQIVQLEPALNGMQDIFKPVALPPEDRAFIERWRNGATDEEFDRMTYRDKSKFMSVYVRLGRGLTDNQFASLPSKLWNEYLNLGVGLTDKQFEMIKDKKDLVRRYTELSIKKFNNLMKQNVSFSYMMPSEWKIIENYSEQLDFDNMSFEQFTELLGIENGVELLEKAKPGKIEKYINSATDDEVFFPHKNSISFVKLVLKYKNKFSNTNLLEILRSCVYLFSQEQIEKEIIPLLTARNLLNRLTEENVESFFMFVAEYSGNPSFRSEGRHFWENIFIKHKYLTGCNIRSMLRYSTNVQNLANTLGEKNLKKIDQCNSDFRYFYKYDPPFEKNNSEEFLNILRKYKRNLDAMDVFSISYNYRKNLEELEKILSEKDLKKLSLIDEQFSDLFLKSDAGDRLNALEFDKAIDFLIKYDAPLNKLFLRNGIQNSNDLKELEKRLGKNNLNQLKNFYVSEIRNFEGTHDEKKLYDFALRHKLMMQKSDIIKLFDLYPDLSWANKLTTPKAPMSFDPMEVNEMLRNAKDKAGAVFVILKLSRFDNWLIDALLLFAPNISVVRGIIKKLTEREKIIYFSHLTQSTVELRLREKHKDAWNEVFKDLEEIIRRDIFRRTWQVN